MAVRADASGDDVRRATNPTGDHTICFWCYPTDVSGATFRTLYWAGTDVDGTGSEGVYMEGDDLQWWAGTDAAARITSANVMVANTWQFIAAVGRGATGSACELFRGTLTAIATSQGTGTRGAGAALSGNRLIFGNDPFTTFGNARIANAVMYDRVLSLTEIREQQQSSLPISAAWGWWPLFDDTTAGLADYSGNARALTETGTVTVEAHTPISWGDLPFGWNSAPAAGGGGSIRNLINVRLLRSALLGGLR